MYFQRKGRRAHFESDDEEEVSKGEKGHHGDGQVAADLFGASDEELEEERTDVWEGRYDNEVCASVAAILSPSGMMAAILLYVVHCSLI